MPTPHTQGEKKMMPKSLVELGIIIGELKAYPRVNYVGRGLVADVADEQMKQWVKRLGEIINQEL